MPNFIVSRRGVLPWIVCAGLSSTRRVFAAPADSTLEAFRDEVIAVGNRRLPEMKLRAGATGAVISGNHNLQVANIFAQLRGLTPSEREPLIVDWLSKFSPAADAKVEAIATETDAWDKAQPLLRPKLLKHLSDRVRTTLLCQPFVGNLDIAYAIDLGDKDLYVSRDKVARWGQAQDAVHACAVANLEGMSAKIGADPVGENGAILDIRMSDGYDAARLILPGLRGRLLKTLGSPFYAAVPARDLFMVWSKGDDKFQSSLADSVREAAATMDHPVSAHVFIVDAAGVRLA